MMSLALQTHTHGFIGDESPRRSHSLNACGERDRAVAYCYVDTLFFLHLFIFNLLTHFSMLESIFSTDVRSFHIGASVLSDHL